MKNLKRSISLCIVIAFVLASGISAFAKDEVRININKATVKELVKLKKVGTKVAEKIVEYREKNGPFAKPEDIMKVSGIGKKIFELNKDMISVSTPWYIKNIFLESGHKKLYVAGFVFTFSYSCLFC